MKRIQSILLGAAGYTVLILLLFYIFASVSGFTESEIGFGMFALILAFGVLISLADRLLYLDALKLPVRIIIHYAALMVAFSVIFIGSGNIAARGAAAIFVAAVVFTALYAVIFVIAYFVRKGVRGLDTALDRRMPKQNAKKKNTEYKPLYK